jgi:glycerol-3-phosphate acyltransferase PlsY
MTKYFETIDEHTKHLIDGVSVATVMGTLMSWLPAIAALFTIIWTVIRIYETKTIQSWLKKGK